MGAQPVMYPAEEERTDYVDPTVTTVLGGITKVTVAIPTLPPLPVAQTALKGLDQVERAKYHAVQWLADQVNGISLMGNVGSTALAFRLAAERSQAWLVVTDARVVIFVEGVVVAQTPVTACRLERAPRWLKAGRLRLWFADGSMVALLGGLVLAGGAKRLVAAWREVTGSLR